MNNEYRDFRILLINIALLVIFFATISSVYNWELKKVLLVLLIGVGFPFLVGFIVSFFIHDEKMVKIVSIATSIGITTITAFILNSRDPDAFFLIALMALLIFVLTLGTATINIFFLLKRFIKDDYKQEIENDEIV